MNDSTLPPSDQHSARSNTNSRSKSASSSSSVRNGSSAAAASAPRAKVGLGRGFGLSDWITLSRHAPNLAGHRPPPTALTKEEVRRHDKPHDGWIILHGKVYNIGPYLAYHPGGQDILHKVLGKDATTLFEKYHRWVNADGLIGNLQLGFLHVEQRREEEDDDDDDSGGIKSMMPPSVFQQPAPRPPRRQPIPALLQKGQDDDDKEETDLNPWETQDK